MASIEPKPCTTRSGSAFQVRTVLPDAAARFLAFCRAVGGESNYLLSQPDEFAPSKDEGPCNSPNTTPWAMTIW